MRKAWDYVSGERANTRLQATLLRCAPEPDRWARRARTWVTPNVVAFLNAKVTISGIS